MEPLFALAGMIGGLGLWLFTIKALIRIAAAGRHDGLKKFFGEQTPQESRKRLAFLLAVSCLWACAFAALANHLYRSSSAAAGWTWFFGGMAAAPVLVWVPKLILPLLALAWCLVIGKGVAAVYSNSSHYINWLAAGLWCFALCFFAWASMQHEAGSQTYLDSKSGRYKPHYPRKVLARFASRTVAITAGIFFLGLLAEAYL